MKQSELIVMETASDINLLRAYIAPFDLVAFDIETTGLNKDSEIIGFSICCEENKAYYVILAKWLPEQKVLEYTHASTVAKGFMETLATKQLICHNGVFDCSMVENYFKVCLIDVLHTDTMILAHLLDENRRVGLKELGASIFGDDAAQEAREVKESVIANGGGATKDNYELYKADSTLLAKYGAKDALLTYKLFLHLVPELYEQGLEKFFYEDESMPLLKGPTYQLNTTGLKVDTQALTTLKKTLEVECAEAKEFIYREIDKHIKTKYPGTKKTTTFNLGASQQLGWLIYGVLGLEFGTLTKGGKDVCRELGLKIPYSAGAKREFIAVCQRAEGTIQQPEATVNGKKVRAKKFKAPWAYIATDKETLKKHAPRYKWIEKLLEYQKKQKILNTYIEGLEERIQYGIIRPSFLQHGTTSGRYASRNPNFQNLPRDDKRIKNCIISRPGRVFVGADYSQLEPRVFAYFSNDARLLEAFRGEDDFYSVIGMEVYQKSDCVPRKDGADDAFGVKYKKLRDLSKVIALASTYGATARKLAPTTGKSVEDTQLDIDNYFDSFPGVRQMMLESHAMAKSNGYVTNLFGRKRRMPEATKIDKMYGKLKHDDLPYDARNLLNLSVNHRIQSTGASICNRAMIKFYNDIKLSGIADCQIVTQVHDELIVECNQADAENVSLILQNAMENAVILDTIELQAVPKIANNFGDLK